VLSSVTLLAGPQTETTDQDGCRGAIGPQPTDGPGRKYPAAAFRGEGVIGGLSVRCLTADYQMANHTGYDPGESDFHDVYALHHKFGIPVPNDYASGERG
jgi:hypothetical protein